ncbi:hypothetical protein RyT2_11520 [Pseudolactococcus yaeyamensis]
MDNRGKSFIASLAIKWESVSKMGKVIKKISKGYRDDEYYTTKESAISFFKKIVLPSNILKHKIIAMPFSKADSPLGMVASRFHDNIVFYRDNQDLWQEVAAYEDVAVIDNPPFSLSAKIERFYFEHEIPFVLFRSAVAYPKFIYEKLRAGIIYENSAKGVQFNWGVAAHIKGDDYIEQHYPNLIDNLKATGVLAKRIPIAFSFYQTAYDFKINTVNFDGGMRYPKKKDIFMYFNRGVFNSNRQLYLGDDGRIHGISD